MAATPWKTSTSALALATLAAATEFRVVDDPAGTPASKKTTAGAIKTFINGLANTWTAAQTVSVAGGASAPAAYYTGAIYTAGTGTTAFPHIFHQPTGATARTDWSTAGTVFGANMATGYTGNFLDVGVAGLSIFRISAGRSITFNGFGGIIWNGNGDLSFGFPGSRFDFGVASTAGQNKVVFSSTTTVGFTDTDGAVSGAPDVIWRRAAAAAFQHGGADAASPVAQTVQVQSVVAGTTNTAGVDWSIVGSKGTGTGAGGSILFKTAPAGSTGSAQNSAATAMTIDSTKKVTFAGGGTSGANLNLTVSAAPTTPADGDVWREDNTNTGLKIRINGVTKTVTVI